MIRLVLSPEEHALLEEEIIAEHRHHERPTFS
jgi:hypothetical protein